MWVPFVKEYEAEHPYCHEESSGIWEWTRNINGLTGKKSHIAGFSRQYCAASYSGELGEQLSARDVHVFHYVTYPEKPEWRIANATCYITLDTYADSIIMRR